MVKFGKLVPETFIVFRHDRYRIDPWRYRAYNLMLLAPQSISCLPVSKDAPPQLAASSRSPLFQHEPRPIVIRDNNSQPHLAEKEMGSPRLSRGRPHNSVRIRHTLRHRNGGRRD